MNKLSCWRVSTTWGKTQIIDLQCCYIIIGRCSACILMPRLIKMTLTDYLYGTMEWLTKLWLQQDHCSGGRQQVQQSHSWATLVRDWDRTMTGHIPAAAEEEYSNQWNAESQDGWAWSVHHLVSSQENKTSAQCCWTMVSCYSKLLVRVSEYVYAQGKTVLHMDHPQLQQEQCWFGAKLECLMNHLWYCANSC